MSNTKTAVFLLGAGAATAWGAKLTGAITDLILNDEQFKTTKGESLGRYLYEALRDYYRGDPDSVNFETLIYALEQLSNHERNKTATGAGASYISSQPLWFTEREETTSVLWNFDLTPLSDDQGMLKNRAENGTGEQVPLTRARTIYLSNALRHYLSIISNEINRYARDCRADKWNDLNGELKRFLTSLIEKGYKLRIYTTNYDRLFPLIFTKDEHLKFFDGFDYEFSEYAGMEVGSLNLERIILDSDSPIYYNLHGCINWEYTSNNPDFQYTFSCTPEIHHAYAGYAIGANANPGEDFIVENIVTGYNKLQRISLEPLNPFQSRFLTDCISADVIITSGYSFSDFHLNKAMKYAVKKGNVKLLNVAYSPGIDYSSGREFEKWNHEILGLHGNDFGRDKKFESNWIISNSDTQRIYNNGLSDFLTSGSWKEIVGWLD